MLRPSGPGVRPAVKLSIASIISSSVISMSRDNFASSERLGMDRLSRKLVCALLFEYSEVYKVSKKYCLF